MHSRGKDLIFRRLVDIRVSLARKSYVRRYTVSVSGSLTTLLQLGTRTFNHVLESRYLTRYPEALCTSLAETPKR